MIVLSLGFFAAVAQALLFREFLAGYAGNELGIGCFFGAWLLWVAAGAAAGRRLRFPTGANAKFEFLPLLYIPAYAAQAVLIRHSRLVAGVAGYELFPLARMLPVSFAANAPVSLVTGFLFTAACRWLSSEHSLAVARVYVLEALGSCAGGVAVTLMLAADMAPESIALWAVLPLLAGLPFRGQTRRGALARLAPAAAAGLLLLAGADRHWTRHADSSAWRRLLPESGFQGAFATAQARYRYGQYGGQFTVAAWESVCETIPNTEHASEVSAVLLAQNPDAKRFLVLGTGVFALAQRLTQLPQTQSVCWLDADPDYPARLMAVLPERLRDGTADLTVPGVDARRFLASTAECYDAIVLNLPDPTTLLLNRYFTREFFGLLKQRLAPAGVLGVRVTGGANVMGSDLVHVGASVFHTLQSVFPHLAIKPGDETWLMASGSDRLSEAPALLRRRFRAIEGATGIYPPEGLPALYPPDRIAFQRQAYERAVRGDARGLLNTESRPRALLHVLLFAGRQAGTREAVSVFVRRFAGCGTALLLMAVLGYVVLRTAYVVTTVWRSRAGPRTEAGEGIGAAGTGAPDGPIAHTAFDSYFLVASAGAVGIAFSVLLMFTYQSRFGSIFLHIGLISALFMGGLTIGGALCERVVFKYGRSALLLPVVMTLHLALLLGVAFMTGDLSRGVFALLFLAGGVLSGCYVPVAAAALKAARHADQAAGSAVEICDHLGGAAGGLATGLLIVPALGAQALLGIAGALLAANLVPALPRRRIAARTAAWFRRRGPASRAAPDLFDRLVRPVGYTLFGIAAFLVIGARVCPPDRAETQADPAQAVARALGKAAPIERQVVLPDGTPLTYYVCPAEAGRPEAYAVMSDKLAPDAAGYGGRITAVLVVEAGGKLLELKILRSGETAAYLAIAQQWLASLRGRNVFEPSGLDGVDAVTGATITSRALLDLLRQAGPRFAAALGRATAEAAAAVRRARRPDAGGVAMLVFVVLALVLRRRAAWRLGRVALLVAVLSAGFVLNVQFSLAHVLSVLALQCPPPGLTTGFVLVACVPVAVALFGNFYCGYLCPVGAAQELAGRFGPRSLAPHKRVWRYARLLKYAVLLGAVCLFVWGRGDEGSSADPLVTVFSAGRTRAVTTIAGLVLALSFFYPRFWCRNLCPAGAFLSLLNGVRLLGPLAPPVNPRRCPYGVRHADELDCIGCDRCTRAGAAATGEAGAGAGRREWGWKDLAFLLVLAAFVAGGAWLLRTARDRPPGPASEAAVAPGAAARMASVDVARIRDLIRQRRLSGREARHYRRADGVPPEPPPQSPDEDR